MYTHVVALILERVIELLSQDSHFFPRVLRLAGKGSLVLNFMQLNIGELDRRTQETSVR